MSSRPRGRILRRSVVVFGFGLLLSLIPLPVLHFETEAVGATSTSGWVTSASATSAVGPSSTLNIGPGRPAA